MLNRFFSTHLISSDFASLLLRIFFGGLMLLNHGLPKFQGWAEKSQGFPSVFGFGSPASLGLAIFSELICAGLLVFGLFTRWASIPLIITMAVAAFMIHGGDPMDKKESALLYLAAYLAIYLLGPGKYSIDDRISPATV